MFWDYEGNDDSNCEDTKIRYKVELLFNHPHDLLGHNYKQCVHRLNGLKKYFHHDPQLSNEYNNILREKNYIWSSRGISNCS